MTSWLHDSPASPDARVAIVGWEQEANRLMTRELRARGIRASLLSPSQALAVLGPGDVAIGRLDVLPTLDGVEPGLDTLGELGDRGVRVLNGPEALLNAHDKLRTAARLRGAGIPHPVTMHVLDADELLSIPLPIVVKPRFGSWGADVCRCETCEDRTALMARLLDRPWFGQQGALVQELVPGEMRDFRLVVAAGEVVGAAERRARPGEWRTNVSLGGSLHPLTPTTDLAALAVEAAAAIGTDFVGVDVLPTSTGFVVIELNGAVEFDRTYDLRGSDVYTGLIRALELPERHLVLS